MKKNKKKREPPSNQVLSSPSESARDSSQKHPAPASVVAATHLPVFENGLSPVEKQQAHVAVSQAEVALQYLQHVDARPHGQRRVAAERVQPGQQVVGSHGVVAEGKGETV